MQSLKWQKQAPDHPAGNTICRSGGKGRRFFAGKLPIPKLPGG
ncbi:hypothetical protein [Sinomicrobium sp. M5D2P17]